MFSRSTYFQLLYTHTHTRVCIYTFFFKVNLSHKLFEYIFVDLASEDVYFHEYDKRLCSM